MASPPSRRVRIQRPGGGGSAGDDFENGLGPDSCAWNHRDSPARNLTAPSQSLPASSHTDGPKQIRGDNFRAMAVLLGNIRLAPDEGRRLLRWQRNAETLMALEAGGRAAMSGSLLFMCRMMKHFHA